MTQTSSFLLLVGDGLQPSSFLLLVEMPLLLVASYYILVVMPGATSSVLAPFVAMPFVTSSDARSYYKEKQSVPAPTPT